MSGYEAWNPTPASNTSVDGDATDDGTHIEEGNKPRTVNNAIRATLAEVAIFRDLIGGAKVSAGTADAQTLATGLSYDTPAYQQGLLIGFEAGSGLTNTGAMTMNVDAIGAKSVKMLDGSDPPAGAVTAGGIYHLAYESGADVLLLLNSHINTDFFTAGPGYASGDYVLPASYVSGQNRTPSTNANVVAYPFFFPEPTSVDGLEIYLVTAQTGAEAMAGLYTNSSGRPATLIEDLGTADLSSGSGSTKTFSASSTVRGWVWALVWLKNVATQVTVTGVGTGVGGVISGSSNSLSAPTTRANLYLEAAYPGSMPSSAPAVAPSSTNNVPVAMLTVA